MIELFPFLVSLVGGYVLGSIPFGLVLAKLFGYGDIRKIGSGNIGATNVLRTGNKPLALAVLLLDSGKGAIAVLLALYLLSFDAAMIAGLAAVIGHLFPVWLKFKGGKGVATTLGTLIALAPLVGLVSCAVWLLMAAVFRYSSLAALVAVLASPIAAHLLMENDTLAGICGILSLLVWLKHRPNIHRLIQGKEPKIGKKSDAK
jgi:glycerol-3-phosphate acyltransferase PlsY